MRSLELKSNLRILMAMREIDDITELMERSGLSRNAINRIYKGNAQEMASSSMKTLIALCDTLECSLSELIEYTPSKK